MSNKERRHANQVTRFIRAPLWALCSARNNYVRGMNGLAHRLSCDAGYFSGDKATSFSSSKLSSGEEDFRELVRVSSQSRVNDANDAVLSSRSVAVGRIDENLPCYFSGDVGIGKSLIFPRSVTCGAGGKRAAAVVPL